MQDMREKDGVRSLRQFFFEEVPGERFDAVGQYHLGYFLVGSRQRRRAVEDTRAKARIFATRLYAEGPGRPADSKQMAVMRKIERLEDCFRPKHAHAVHGLCEVSLGFGVVGNFLERVARPSLRLIRLDGFGESAPGKVEMPMHHRDVIAEVVRP